MYKCNARDDPNRITSGGDWDDFFAKSREHEWGGTDTIKGRKSRKIMRECMHSGDIIFAYQTDKRAAIGYCRLRRFIKKNNRIRMILKKIKRFKQPIKLHELKKSNAALRRVRALQRRGTETLYEVSYQEARTLFSVCGERKISALMSPKQQNQEKRGAGFGEPEINKKVEAAAVKYAKKWYHERGWTVRSVEKEKPGYDLQCKRNKIEEHVEVKGVSGTILSFPITAPEKRKAKEDPDFVLFVVTSALSTHPLPRRWRGPDFLKNFNFEPLQFIAREKR